jgi:hypothetical protein
MAGGTAVAIAGDSDSAAGWVGLGMILAGALLKASSRADVRHNDLLPHAVYVAAIHVGAPDSTIELGMGDDGSRAIVLASVDPPAATRGLQVLYLRVPPSPVRLEWADSGAVFYANDEDDRPVEGGDLPYILGGRCVRAPSRPTLDEYQRAGRLLDFTLNDLENLYREEGLAWTIEDQGGFAGRHVLEGGTSLVCPRPGSAGYARLFGQLHPPYEPRSRWCRELADEISGSPAGASRPAGE